MSLPARRRFHLLDAVRRAPIAFVVILALGGCGEGEPPPRADEPATEPSRPSMSERLASPPRRTKESEQLFFAPGGAYTEADVTANGDLTPYERFRGIEIVHRDAVAGETICPVSGSRGNPAITWRIGGESYSFCCPPCIEDLVRIAKDSPQDLKPAAHFVKR
jgi:hypothetical protein